jgi:hypothetical protein
MFKKGDKVKCVDAAHSPLKEGEIYEVAGVVRDGNHLYLSLEMVYGCWLIGRFLLAQYCENADECDVPVTVSNK